MKRLTNKTTISAGILATVFCISGCAKSSSTTDDITGDWSRGSDFEGVARTEGVTFSIGETAYVGSGFDGNDRLTDYWAFDATTGTWTQKADLPAAARSAATAFSVNGKGYVGTGYDGITKLKDFYQYDPAANSWTKKADLPGSARYDASGFSVNGKGYITCGFDGNYLKDLWEYDPAGDEWIQKASLGGTKRSGAQVFVIDSKAYVAGGINNGTYPDDFWAYDQASNTWEQKRKISNISDEDYDDDYADIARSNGVTFVMDSKAYLVCGERNGIIGTCWEYNPVTDLWTSKTALEASARSGAIAFTAGNVGYITTGNSSSYRFDDLWKFNPNIAQVDNN